MKKKKNELREVESQEIAEDEIDKSEAPEESPVDQEIDLETAEKETDTEEVITPEVAAIHTDIDSVKELESKTVKSPKSGKLPKPKLKSKSKKRSQKYLKSIESVDKAKSYSIEEAIGLVKSGSYSKFDATVTLSVRLEKSKKSAEEGARGVIKLPYGTGKKLKVEIADDELIEKIKKGWTGFDILIASAQVMPKLAQVAKILGPKGKMPNPKDGTVVEDPKSAVEELSEKTVRYRSDLGRNIHIPVGKVSWDEEKLAENIKAALKGLSHLKRTNLVLSPSMGAGVKITI